MRQAGVHKIAFRHGHYLGFVLQPPESRRKHNTVVIALKLAAHRLIGTILFIRTFEALLRDQFAPVSGGSWHHKGKINRYTALAHKYANGNCTQKKDS